LTQVSLETDERVSVGLADRVDRSYDTDYLRAALAGRNQRRLKSNALLSTIDTSRRASLRIHEIVRANGDETPIVFEKGVLLWGVEWIPAVIVASDIAVHIIEYHSQNSAVCSYNRLMRFDQTDNGGTITLGLCLYLGARPIAEKLAVRQEFLRSELALHVLEAPKTVDLMRVIEKAGRGFVEKGVPESAHPIRKFVF
jgi:hypothetical protein